MHKRAPSPLIFNFFIFSTFFQKLEEYHFESCTYLANIQYGPPFLLLLKFYFSQLFRFLNFSDCWGNLSLNDGRNSLSNAVCIILPSFTFPCQYFHFSQLFHFSRLFLVFLNFFGKLRKLVFERWMQYAMN